MYRRVIYYLYTDGLNTCFFFFHKTHIAVNQTNVFLTFTALRTLYMYVIQEIPCLACTEQMLVGLGTERLLLSRCVLERLS